MSEKDLQQFAEDMGKVIGENTDLSISNAKLLLEQKYGMSFEAKKIGDRLDKDTADLYMYPETMPNLIFKAVVNNETMECSDNLIRRIVGASISKEFAEEMAKKNIELYACSVFICDDDSEEKDIHIPAEEYFEKYNAQGMMFYAIVNGVGDDSSDNVLKKMCNSLSQNYHLTVALNAYYLSDNYNSCKTELSQTLNVSSTWFKLYEPTRELEYSAIYSEE